MSSNVRRIVTSHDETGKATFRNVDELPMAAFPIAGMKGAVIWTTANVPADNLGDTEGERRNVGNALKSGSVLWVTEFAAGFESPLHRTFSVDYGVVISGTLELELDGGDCERLGPGDLIVQRGTGHRWRNPSASEPCRIVMSMIEARPVIIDGTELPSTLE